MSLKWVLGAKIKVLVGLESPEENLFHWLLQLLDTAQIICLMSRSLQSMVSVITSPSLMGTPLASLLQVVFDYITPIQIIQYNPSHLNESP